MSNGSLPKVCSKCRRALDRSRFVRDSERRDGLKHWCKDCCRARALQTAEKRRERERTYRKENPERARERDRANRAANPEARRAYARSWRAQHLEMVRAAKKRHRAKPNVKASMQAYKRSYSARPEVKVAEASMRRTPEYRVWNRLKSIRRRARHRGATGSFDWNVALDRYCHQCAFCGASDALTVDHIVPLVRGGSNGQENIRPLCRSCNSAKGGRLDTELPETLKRRAGVQLT